MEERGDSEDGYYPDILPLQLDDESSDPGSPFSKPLTINEVEHYVDIAQQTEEPSIVDEESKVVRAELLFQEKVSETYSSVSYPETPRWNFERPYLTGHHTFLDNDVSTAASFKKHVPGTKMENVRSLDAYSPSVQELIIVDELLDAMVGTDGNYVRVRKGRTHKYSFVFYVDQSLNSSLHELANRILPICENYMVVSQFTEARSQFKHGLTNHAFAAGLRAILQDYHAMVAQVEHQFRLGRLSLPGLWFFVQPMLGAMQCLSAVLQTAIMQSASGATLLNLLHNQAAAMAGDSSVRALLQKLTHAASRWVDEGVIDDPYGEFLIEENKTLDKKSLSQDYHATYWQKRYSLREEIPEFLMSSANIILTTGKYLNAIRECGHMIQGPTAGEVRAANPGLKRPYLERINVAHKYASAELLDLIRCKVEYLTLAGAFQNRELELVTAVYKDQFDLVGRLRSVKHYFFIDKGDFLVLFMDTAKDELAKRPSAMSKERLKSLLELALRTSVAASDPYHDDLTCGIEMSTVQVQLQKIMENENALAFRNTEQERLAGTSNTFGGAIGSITGVDTFILDYKVAGVISAVEEGFDQISTYLSAPFSLQACQASTMFCLADPSGLSTLQLATRPYDITRTAMSRSYAVCQRMLHFVQSLEHYMTFEVLEPNWHGMHTSLLISTNVDEVMEQHESFLDKCLKQCMFFWPSIFKKVDNLKDICLQYSTATQWLIPTLFINDNVINVDSARSVDSPLFMTSGEASPRAFSYKKSYNGRISAQSKLDPQRARRAADDRNFKNSLAKIDADFSKELRQLVELLISGTQQEPYLADLVQALEAMAMVDIHSAVERGHPVNSDSNSDSELESDIDSPADTNPVSGATFLMDYPYDDDKRSQIMDAFDN